MNTHKVISFIKSGVRMFGYVLLWTAFPTNPEMFWAGVVLLLSEGLGVIEEIDE